VKLIDEIQKNLNFILKSGFSIIDSNDLGMAKWCRLSNSKLYLIIWSDRNDIDAILEYGDKSFNLLSLTKFLNKDFNLAHYSTEIKLQQIDNIIENNYNNIWDFLLHLNESRYREYENFHKTENFSSF
jgi:hypothetical protein